VEIDLLALTPEIKPLSGFVGLVNRLVASQADRRYKGLYSSRGVNWWLRI